MFVKTRTIRWLMAVALFALFLGAEIATHSTPESLSEDVGFWVHMFGLHGLVLSFLAWLEIPSGHDEWFF